jgi:preprotein translocase subunit SecA
VRERLQRAADESAAARAARYSPDIMRQIERLVLLQTLDALWREHLVMLEHLRQVIGFRGYAQRDPLNEYKTEAFELFQAMLTRLRETVTAQMMRIEIVQQQPPPLAPGDLATLEERHADPFTGENEIVDERPRSWPPTSRANGRGNGGGNGGRVLAAAATQIDPKNPATWGKVQRNAACPCGSGKKYKHCHGALA